MTISRLMQRVATMPRRAGKWFAAPTDPLARRRRVLELGCAALFAVGAPALAAGAAYPVRPISLVVPYNAGGVTDLAARALAEGMSRHLPQPVVVVNKPGASGALGGATVATADPDGYTLGFFPLGAALPEVFRFAYSAAYKSTDLKPISSAAGTTMVFAVAASSPFKSMHDVVQAAREKQGLIIGTSGSFTLPSMIMTMMASKEGVKLENVAFGSDNKTLPALLGGHVEVAAIDYSVLKGFIEAGKVRALATCTEQRTEYLPDVPTVRELGYELPYVSALGLFGPPGLPADVVERLDGLVAKVTGEAAFQQRMRELNILTLYKDAATYAESLVRDHHNLERFFTAQGAYRQ